MKRFIFFLTLFFIIFILYSCNGSKRYKTAYIAKVEKGFIITLKGRGTGHPAGPLDVVFPKTFKDSMQYLIPRDQGLIAGEELPYDSCCYKSTGSIKIEGSKMKIDLYYKNTDDNRLDPGTWNGEYNLVKEY